MTSNPDQWQPLHEGRLSAMTEVARAAGEHTLKYYRTDGLKVDAKKDDSPVTIADREAEQLVRKMLAERFPEDTLQGEEFAEQTGSSPYRWVVDPIDGTKSFVCGVPLYSTLLAVEHEGIPIAGVIFIPALGEMIVGGAGQGSWYKTSLDSAWKKASVSSTSDLSKAVFVVSQVDSFAKMDSVKAYLQLEKEAWVTRSWGDGYGYLMVATGRADLMVDPICNPWDVAPMKPILEQAGGQFTDWNGEATVRGGNGVGTNGRLHDAVLSHLKPS
ncbi:Histidinol-phosphatase [Planctomycetes bacterium CA13]|uniref:Histidinol-phosphatase n=1 Tax=Novipirellula herctigrandis TaxID=2527986 RepID=A0A5C5Z7X2_9BACT|nr:Histidinol-phosphatase [Planctomycetes bacterium CA13]